MTCDEKVKEILDACTADNELAEKNRAKYEELLAREEELIQSTINDKTSEIESQLEEQFKLEIKKKKSLMDKKYKTIEIMDEWVLIFCSIWSVVQAIVNKWIRADLIEIALILRGIIVKCFSYIVKLGYDAGQLINVGEHNGNLVLQGIVHMITWLALLIIVYGLPLIVFCKVISTVWNIIYADDDERTIAIINVIMIGLATCIRVEPPINLFIVWTLIHAIIIGIRHFI